jgi:hypothetical protein
MDQYICMVDLLVYVVQKEEEQEMDNGLLQVCT